MSPRGSSPKTIPSRCFRTPGAGCPHAKTEGATLLLQNCPRSSAVAGWSPQSLLDGGLPDFGLDSVREGRSLVLPGWPEGKAATPLAASHAAKVVDLLAGQGAEQRQIDLADRRIGNGKVVKHAIVSLDLGSLRPFDGR